jgi:putative phage-type endonuclease
MNITSHSIDIRSLSYEEWKEQRRRGIGGSDVAALLGISKWKTPLQLYLEKIGEYQENINSESAYWGTKLEDLVAKEFSERTGKKVHRVNRILIHPFYDFLIANIDRRVVGEDAILEVKTTSSFNKDQWEGDQIPNAYILQVMHYLNITGASKAYFAVLIGGQKFIWKEIERDEELIQMVREREIEFWENHVLKENPPNASAYDDELLKKLYPEANQKESVPLPSEVDQAIEEINVYSEQLKELETKKKERENRIKELLRDHESGYTHQFIVNWKNITSNRLDAKKLKSERPEIVEEYLKASTYRRFNIKEVKA